jgi:hypothetical protein
MPFSAIIKLTVAVLGLTLAGFSPVRASVLYNTNGASFLVGNDGKRPPVWVGNGAAPMLSGTMDLMWYANLQPTDVAILSTADAKANGAATNFRLGTGPAAWASVATGGSASGHGLDYGLIHLNGLTDLTILMETDTGSATKPAFSLYQGWDTSSTPFVRTGSYINNVSNPLATVGLTYLNQASTTLAGGSASLTFHNLSGGNYTLLLGGNGTSNDSFGNGSYKLTLTAVPLPGAVWLFGSAMAGFIGLRHRNKSAA